MHGNWYNVAATTCISVAVDDVLVVAMEVVTKIWDQETLPSLTKGKARHIMLSKIVTIIVTDVV